MKKAIAHIIDVPFIAIGTIYMLTADQYPPPSDEERSVLWRPFVWACDAWIDSGARARMIGDE